MDVTVSVVSVSEPTVSEVPYSPDSLHSPPIVIVLSIFALSGAFVEIPAVILSFAETLLSHPSVFSQPLLLEHEFDTARATVSAISLLTVTVSDFIH